MGNSTKQTGTLVFQKPAGVFSAKPGLLRLNGWSIIRIAAGNLAFDVIF